MAVYTAHFVPYRLPRHRKYRIPEPPHRQKQSLGIRGLSIANPGASNGLSILNSVLVMNCVVQSIATTLSL